MLYKTDAEIVMEWLGQALPAAEKKGVTKADLARHCDVKPQAVNGWIKTGRISKTKLKLAEELLGSSPRFDREPQNIAQETALSEWPFQHISRLRYGRLPADVRAQIEDLALVLVKNAEQAATPAKHAPPVTWRTVAIETLNSLHRHGKRVPKTETLARMIDEKFIEMSGPAAAAHPIQGKADATT